MKSEQELVNEYPEIYELHGEDVDAPAPQISTFGFQHGEGWHGIIESLCEVLSRREVDVTVLQQKEKFGGLRFYDDGIEAKEEIESYMAIGAISHAEEMSFHVCEKCGDAGSHRNDGYMKTLCDECYDA